MQDTNDLYVKLQVHLAVIAAIVAAALLFTLLTNSNTASAQQAIASTVTPTPAASTPDFPPAPPKRTPPLGNLDSMLSQLAERVQGGYATAHDAASQAPIHNADSIAVTFYFNGDTAPLLAFLRANGGDPRNIGEDYVEAYVPVTLLAEASERPNVVRVQAIEPPSPDRGSVTSQGVAAHAANAWHDAGYTGEGIKVGVIDSGFEGIRSLIGSELPSNVVARCYTDVGVFTSNLADCENGNDHGTAVSETLLDIAPDAALYIAMPESRGDMRSAVDWLVSQDVDVINRSVSSTWDGPGDGTSPYSDSPLRSVDAAVSGGIMWANSAGSDAQSAWLGSFSNPDSDRWLNFDNGSDNDILNGVYLEAGRRFAAQLRWEGSWTAAESDLDLHLYKTDDLYLPVAYSNEEQLGRNGQIPSERLSYTPTESGRYGLAVQYLSGDVPGWVQLLARKDHSLQYHTEGGGIRNPAESTNPGMLAVGSATLLGCEHNSGFKQPRTHARRQNKARHSGRNLRRSRQPQPALGRRSEMLARRHERGVAAGSGARGAGQAAFPPLHAGADCELSQIQRRAARRRRSQQYMGLRFRQIARPRSYAVAHNNAHAHVDCHAIPHGRQRRSGKQSERAGGTD